MELALGHHRDLFDGVSGVSGGDAYDRLDHQRYRSSGVGGAGGTVLWRASATAVYEGGCHLDVLYAGSDSRQLSQRGGLSDAAR